MSSNLEKLLKKNLRVIPNFPKKGIMFQDIFSILEKPRLLKMIVKEISDVIRKKGKLPGEVFKKKYKLEYGFDQIEIQKGSLLKKDRVLIVDDLIATGGTALASAKLVENMSDQQISFMFVIDLYNLNGSIVLKKKGYNVFDIIKTEG